MNKLFAREPFEFQTQNLSILSYALIRYATTSALGEHNVLIDAMSS